ncbi:hypothetical protein FS792_06850, partial [Pseudomonas aeruginosa]
MHVPIQAFDEWRARARARGGGGACAGARGLGRGCQHVALCAPRSGAENSARARGAEAGSPRRLEARIREVAQRYGMPLEPRRLVHG